MGWATVEEKRLSLWNRYDRDRFAANSERPHCLQGLSPNKFAAILWCKPMWRSRT